MIKIDTISTETWQMVLPSDWTEKNTSDSCPIYFESPDGTKGVYISTWQFTDDARSVEEIAASFQAVERRSFTAMEDHAWSITETNATEANAYVSTLYCFSRAKKYRVICRFLGSLPWVVRASFHDYTCADLTDSDANLVPLVSSLQLHQSPT